MKKTILSIVGVGLMFGACASNSLELDTKLNNSIFIEPVAKSKKNIFVFAKKTLVIVM
ncbi:complement resistance protein TraT [Campylobacter sp. RM12651]|uniref:complement resistance protein TraT n=1 Tax=Campylobacter sp. RM12651 TaxID=1660079 RepID=UPI001EFBD008|nr:complement resistance protein TraT [Campylobacter sp. RM12651]